LLERIRRDGLDLLRGEKLAELRALVHE